MSLLWARGSTPRSFTWIFVECFEPIAGFRLFLADLSWDSVVLQVESMVLLGVAMPIVGPPFITFLQQLTPPPLMGKVLAVRSTIGSISDAEFYLLTK